MQDRQDRLTCCLAALCRLALWADALLVAPAVGLQDVEALLQVQRVQPGAVQLPAV